MNRLTLFLLLLISCNPSDKKIYVAPTENANGEKIVRKWCLDGKVQSEITLKNGKRNGVAKTYDENGALVLELNYVDDMKEGPSKKYYPGGTVLAQTTEYEANLKNGLQVRYRSNGGVMSETRYENDFPCSGLKEYSTSHVLREKYPTIEINVSKSLDANGAQKLLVSLSEKVRSVKFYSGSLNSHGCLTDDLHYLRFHEATRTAEMPYYVQTSGVPNAEVNIIAVFETLMGNTAIAQRKYHVTNTK